MFANIVFEDFDKVEQECTSSMPSFYRFTGAAGSLTVKIEDDQPSITDEELVDWCELEEDEEEEVFDFMVKNLSNEDLITIINN